LNFAILPPRFKASSNNEFLFDALRTCFPTLNSNIFNVGKFALASLVHHAEYLREVLPPNHVIFETILFRNSQLFSALKEMIITGHASSLDSKENINILLDLVEELNQLVDTMGHCCNRLQAKGAFYSMGRDR
jgi:hypothetical protein